jgi:hypothetical protein
MEEKCKWAWMMEWCKQRYYPPAGSWAWKYAGEAWQQRQDELAEAYAISSCWYCQLGIDSGRLSLRSVPEPPNWKETLCEHHLDSPAPVHNDGEDVTCEICDDRLDEEEPGELDHLTNLEKAFGVRDY